MSGQNSSLIMTLLVGGIAGWLAGLLTRGSGYGLIGDVIVGLLGAFVGSYLLPALNISFRLGNPWMEKGLVAFTGAVALLLLISLLRPRSVTERVGDWWRRR